MQKSIVFSVAFFYEWEQPKWLPPIVMRRYMVETRRCVTVTTFYAVKTPGSGNFIPSTTAQDLGSISLHINKLSNTKDKKLNKILTKHATIWM